MLVFPEQAIFRLPGKCRKSTPALSPIPNSGFVGKGYNNGQYLTTFVSSGTTSNSVMKHDTYTSVHQGPPLASWEMNSLKGTITEKAMDRGLMTGAFESSSWSVVTPDKVGNRGIDGIYFRTDKSGNLRSLMVAEAKYGTSKLGKTGTGVQMSRTWTRPRLLSTARSYSNLSKEIYRKGAYQTRLQPPEGTKVISIPYKEGKTIHVWKHNGNLIYYSDEPVPSAVVAQQAKRTSMTLSAAANGQMDYRSSLFRFDVKNGQWKIEIQRLDPETAKPIGPPKQIPITESTKKQLAKSLEEAFVQDGCSREKAKALAKKCVDDPDFFKKMRRNARMNWKSGLDFQTMKIALLSGFLAFGLSVAISVFSGSVIDWKRSIGISLLTAGATFIGQYAGIQVASALLVTDIGKKLISVIAVKVLGIARLANTIGGFFGGIITSALVSYGSWILGYCDIRTANKSMASGAIGSLGGIIAYFGAQGAVIAFGTASTGTAISSLSGAAAANAAIAWFGGGSLAAGGLGASAGAMILTGGAAVVAIVLGAGATIIFGHLDQKKRKMLVRAKIDILSIRISQGMQPEWQTV
jgi:hypothetical protein